MVNGKLTNLSNYRTLEVSKSQGDGRDFNTYPRANSALNSGRHGLWMGDLSETHIMAEPSAIKGGGRFTVTQDHCS